VKFLTQFEVTGVEPPEVSQDMFRRLVCFVVLNHLQGQSLISAYEALTDIYSWHRAQTEAVELVPHRRFLPVSKVRRVERVPFIVSDEE
jgi:hypothetical protein